MINPLRPIKSRCGPYYPNYPKTVELCQITCVRRLIIAAASEEGENEYASLGSGSRGLRSSGFLWGINHPSTGWACGFRFGPDDYGPRGLQLLWSGTRSEEHTSELQSLRHLVCR